MKNEPGFRARRVLIAEDPYSAFDEGRNWAERGTWPCCWISLADLPDAPFVAAYRLVFTLEAASTLRLHVSADERYDLFCDGVRLGRGPERGDAAHWFYETYELALDAGEHRIAAKVWSFGSQAPYSQMSVRHGFILGAEGAFLPLVGTGLAAWECKRVGGCETIPVELTWAAGAKLKIDGAAYPWGCEQGLGEGWTAAQILHPGVNSATRNEWPARHRLRPASLPPQIDVSVGALTVRQVDDTPLAATQTTPVLASRSSQKAMAAWQELLNQSAPVVLPARICCRAILDFGDYQSVYPELIVSGGAGAQIRVHWAEGLYEGTGALSLGGSADARGKGNRDEIEGKCFLGEGDIFLPDGGSERRFENLWWAAGRYLEVAIETGDAPLTLTALRFRETRYPLFQEGRLAASDSQWESLIGLCVRTVQMCAHETYMDCPYYEQLQYLGDTRLQALATFVLMRDDRLPRKALLMGAASILGDQGLAQSRYPSRVAQVIPPFSLWWIAMLHDFALWRGDLPFVRKFMPQARLLLESFLALCGDDGLMRSPVGWNFTDWVPAWTATTNDTRNWGVPPDGETGVSGVLNWHLVYTLNLVAELEGWLGEPELAARWKRRASELTSRVEAAFWDAQHGFYADDLGHRHYSEHAQCLALMSRALPPERERTLADNLFRAPGIERATIYFTHYLFECAAATGHIQPLFERMESLWFPLSGMGFKALPEEPEPCRSDCHAWGAHPLYHFYATVLGIRPAAPGATHLVIRPQLGPLQRASGTLPHPGGGEIVVALEKTHEHLSGQITLPPGITAELQVNGRTYALKEGSFELPRP